MRFLGWGASDKPIRYRYTAANQIGDLDAVLEHLRLGSVVLVAHDAMPGLRAPEAIRLCRWTSRGRSPSVSDDLCMGTATA